MDFLTLEKHLDGLLSAPEFADYGPNGIQVEAVGKPDIRKMAFAVSSSLDVIRIAASQGADALLVHHGLFWKNVLPLRGSLVLKISALMSSGIHLYAYHLPLDAHPELGNNAPALRRMGVSNPERLADIGFMGELPAEISAESHLRLVDSVYGNNAIHIIPEEMKSGNAGIRKVGIVSGAGYSYFEKAIAAGCHAFISGESTEWVYAMAREAGVVFSAVGHNRSEEVGVKNLMEFARTQWGLETFFVGEDNPF